jgi:glucose-1-phosphate thymidylyltransferase
LKAQNRSEVIGLIPAAGRATRVAPLPCSKELYPIGFRAIDHGQDSRPKVVCHYLLERLRLANVNAAYIILRHGKWDIPSYFGDGKIVDIHLGYLMMDLPFGVPYTLDQAYFFVRDKLVAFGFPDIIFYPDDAFVHLFKRQSETNADVVLGLFPTDQPHKMDMVEVGSDGKVRKIRIKPADTDLDFTWIIAVWTPDFTRFMHEYILNEKITIDLESNAAALSNKAKELFLGDVIQAAIQDDMNVSSVTFANGKCLDIGSSEDMIKAIQMTI